MKEQLIQEITTFLKTEVINNPNVVIGGDDQIIKLGLIDSMGIVRLVNHLQKQYCIKKIERKDMVLDNFKTINRIAAVVSNYVSN